MSKPLICLDAGHYKNTPGKRCLKSIDPKETREWALNSRIAEYVTEELKKYNCDVMRADDMTGAKDIQLGERVSRANKAKADYYISIHHNAGIKGGSGGGICIYIAPNASETSKKLQKAVYNGTIKYTGLKGNRSNPLPTSNLYVCRYTVMPAILGEFGFMDSTKDTPIIITDEFARNCAKGIVEGLAEVANLEKVASPRYKVQVGSFKNRDYAEDLRDELKGKGYDAFIVETN